MNIILDRFPHNRIDYFIKFFNHNHYNTRVATILAAENYVKVNENISIYGDFDIANGSVIRNETWSLDSYFLNELSKFEGIFNITLSRFVVFPGNWPIQDMSDHYLLLTNFWYNLLLRNDIKSCFSYTAPHDPSSLALYIVSKILKIPYIFIDVPHIAKRIRFVSCSFKYRNLLLRSNVGKTPKWAELMITEYLIGLKEDFRSNQPFFMKTVHENLNKKFSIDYFFVRKFLENLLKVKFKSLINLVLNYILEKPPVFFKNNTVRWDSMEKDIILRFRWLLTKLYTKWRIKKLKKKYYRSLTSNFKFKYIYFPLPLEPEASTIPTATIFKSVNIAIKRILDELPKDCVLLLKINPIQFQTSLAPYSTFSKWHYKDFFSDLQMDERIKFASDRTDSGMLIRESIGVACINGTAAIEAAALGKSAIIFSPMWYDCVDNIYLCETQNQIKEAIGNMINFNHINNREYNISLSPDIIFDQGALFENEFNVDIIENVANCLLSGLAAFNDLDNRKWEF